MTTHLTTAPQAIEPSRFGARRRVAVAICALVIVGYGPAAASAAKPRVSVTRDSAGIPHIVGKDFRSVGYGEGYAYAQDNLCTFADEVITLRAQSSKYFRPDALFFQYAGGRGNRPQLEVGPVVEAGSPLTRGREGRRPEPSARARRAGQSALQGLGCGLQRVPARWQAARPGLRGQAVGEADRREGSLLPERADRDDA